MEIKELKRELSRLSGVDFFNPKYRETFKKFFPEAGDDAAEDAKAEDVKAEDVKEETAEAASDTSREDIKGDSYGEMEEKIKENEQDIDMAEDRREIDKIEKERTDNPEEKAEKEHEIAENSEEIGEKVDDLKGDKAYAELLEARIENELLRGGVREDRLDHAMRLAKSEIGSMEELHKVKDILADFPEWVRTSAPTGYGMDIDRGEALTAEQKRLKEIGVDPY